MTFGRPAMISRVSSGAVPLPVIVDDEYIVAGDTSEPSQPADQPSMMGFYAKSLDLYEIMNDVLLSLYKPISDEHTDEAHDFYFNNVISEGERTIFDLDRSLTRWTRTLPPHLRADFSASTDNQIFCRQRIVLHARFVDCTYSGASSNRFLPDSFMCACCFSVPLFRNSALPETTQQVIRWYQSMTPFHIVLHFNARFSASEWRKNRLS